MANNDVTKKVPMELICMSILHERDMYGYEMLQEIEKRSDKLLMLNLASIYIALHRLEERGYVSTRNEMSDARRARMRVYYHLEPSAEAYREKLMADYLQAVTGVQNLLKTTEKAHEKRKA